MNKQYVSGMRGWTELCSDVNWQDYGGMWTRPSKANNTAYYVVRFTNLHDAMGERDCEATGTPQYEAEVKLVDLALIPETELDAALRCCGFKWSDARTSIVSDYQGDMIANTQRDCELVLVECCIQYGLGAPLESFMGETRPSSVRAKARRFAEDLIRDEHGERLRDFLSRPVNAIGSTALEYGVGDLRSAMDRHLRPAVVTMKQSDLLKCKFAIILPDHYRADGSCKCDDASHRATMIAMWGYSREDFADVPLRA
jgi:hypothetical protein